MTTSTRVLIVDGNLDELDPMCTLFDAEQDFEVAGTAVSGEEALTKAYILHPDAVVLGASVANGATLRLLPLLRLVLPRVGIVVFETGVTNISRDIAVRAGADEFVCATRLADELVPSLRRAVLTNAATPLADI
jgi:DNA-binding NarL/FixJ family response regulator